MRLVDLLKASLAIFVVFTLSCEKNYHSVFIYQNWTQKKIDSILQESSKLKTREERVSFISEKLLGTPYKSGGVITDEEMLVIRLDGVDCMTFVEQVEALSVSKNFKEFKENLRKIRYQNGIVSYETRNHFFTDWIEFNGFKDVGRKIAPEKAIVVKKHLNYKKGKGVVLKGVPVKVRTFSYIPSDAFSEEVILKLKTGDIVGAYAYKENQDWLDITHMGYIIKKDGKTYFRNASSLKKYMKVVDIPLKQYLKRVKGLVILRKED